MCAAPRLLVLLGTFLMTAGAVAHAQEPVPTATPTAIAIPATTPTVTPEATATATATATPTAEVTPAPTPTATATTTAVPTPTPTAAVRQDATPTATPEASPTATPTPGFDGASLTICHYTADPERPYAPVVIDAGAFDGHFDHELDVIPAPPGGCAAITDPDRAHDAAVFVCHATGDPDRPFTIEGQYPAGDLGGHEGHEGDIIPAPKRTCPGLDFYAVPSPTAEPSPAPTAEPTATPTPDGGDDEPRGGRRLGDTLPTFSGAMVASTQGATLSAQQLPFTGFELWLIAAAGLAMTMMGLGLRLLAQPPDVGVTR